MMPARSNSAGGGNSNNKVKYSRLADSDEGYIDLQILTTHSYYWVTRDQSKDISIPFILCKFKRSPPKVPYKAIALATFLFLVGTLLIIIGSLLLTGYLHVENPDRTIPVLIIGVLIFLPGFYHLRIAYYASKGYRGYSYEDIPDFDD